MRAPLYKMDLRTGGIFPSFDTDDLEEEIEESFGRAMKWDAVLLIDECDTYLQKRSDQDSTRNRLVAGKCFGSNIGCVVDTANSIPPEFGILPFTALPHHQSCRLTRYRTPISCGPHNKLSKSRLPFASHHLA